MSKSADNITVAGGKRAANILTVTARPVDGAQASHSRTVASEQDAHARVGGIQPAPGEKCPGQLAYSICPTRDSRLYEFHRTTFPADKKASWLTSVSTSVVGADYIIDVLVAIDGYFNKVRAIVILHQSGGGHLGSRSDH